jgi:diguanylate cyclase (GGDEF)-like protein
MSEDKTVVAESFADSLVNSSKGGDPVLLQYDGQGAGKKFPLKEGRFTIGRKEGTVEIWVDDHSVSRAHCELEITSEAAFVKDLGSLNHTYVNDQKIEQQTELFHGDMLRAGNVKLRYFAHGSTDELLFDRIYQMAVTDKMLDIFRKEYLLEQLELEFKNSQNTFLPLSMMFLDLDKFKPVNDTYGHAAGDFILIETCKIIKSLIRESDVFGRYGGEEMCLLLPNTDLETGKEMAEKIRAALEGHEFNFEGTVIPITASIGVATFLGDNHESGEKLLQAADTMVYKAKDEGRNRVCA